jgi:hypothetical protein
MAKTKSGGVMWNSFYLSTFEKWSKLLLSISKKYSWVFSGILTQISLSYFSLTVQPTYTQIVTQTPMEGTLT